MNRFLFCSTVFNKKQYTILEYEDKHDVIDKLNYLLTHREEPVIWPLFTKSDVEELVPMDKSLASVLRGLTEFSDICKIRYNGLIYQVDEIKPSRLIKGYWNILTDKGIRLLDPVYIEFTTGC